MANQSPCLPATIIRLPWRLIRLALMPSWWGIRWEWLFWVMRILCLSQWRKCFIIVELWRVGQRSALLIGDMPFMSYQVSVEEAIRNAGRFLQEGGMDAVKLEGGRERLDTVRGIVAAGIPVMGHLGLTPQSIHALGGFHPQGRTTQAARHMLEDALCLEEAGCFSLVLELIPARLAELISKRISIPTIGIGAGAGCDGQVLVVHDMLGLFDRFTPRFVKQYADLQGDMQRAFGEYIADVTARRFPAQEHMVEMPEEEWQLLLGEMHAG